MAMIAKNIVLEYPDFPKESLIYAGVSTRELKADIMQKHSDNSVCTYDKMSAEIHWLFHEDPKHAKADRGKPRHDPPLCFVPSKVSKKKDGDDSTLKMISIELDQKMTQKVLPYGYIDIETFLGMQKYHKYIPSQQETRKKYDRLQ